MRRPVAVTGVGLVSPLGEDPAAVWAGVLRGVPAASPAFSVPGRGPVPVGGIPDFDLGKYYKVAAFRRLMSRESGLAVVAVRHALASAGIEPGRNVPAEAIAFYAGTGATGLDFSRIVAMVDASAGPDGAFDEERFCREGIRKVHPLLSFQILPNMPPCFSSIVHGIRGDHLILNPWEGQAGLAILEGFTRVAEGSEAVALVAGSDVKTHSQAYVFLHQAGLFHDAGARAGIPFDPESRCAIPGEGAACLVLEDLDGAAGAGRPVRALLRGGAAASDAAAGWGYTSDPRLLAALVRRALDDASVRPGDVDLVLASANGTAAADRIEREALDAVVPGARTLAPKAGLTDTFAAAAPLSLALAVHAIGTGAARTVLVDCFGNGTERTAFVLSRPGEERDHA